MRYAETMKLKDALREYTLYRDLAAESREWYQRVVGVYCSWAGSDIPISEFTGESISRLLHAKQKAGRSPHYIKSLRNALVALLRDIRGHHNVERIRTVKATPIDVKAWKPAEIEKLLAACSGLPEWNRQRMELAIALGYYTGLDRCDLERLTQSDIKDDGTILFRRRKTKSLIVVKIPRELLAVVREHCPDTGPILRMGISKEWFRKIFGGIVKRAGLFGTFKKLRKSSGSNVEAARPGTGHRHLGNTRAIFERHYEAKALTHGEPTMPPAIALPGKVGVA